LLFATTSCPAGAETFLVVGACPVDPEDRTGVSLQPKKETSPLCSQCLCGEIHKYSLSGKVSGMKIYLPPLILMGLIFILSSISMDGKSEHLKFLMELTPTVQNLLHIPMFGLLAYLWLNALTKNGCPAKKKLIITIIITLGYGCLDEFHQLFVPGRYASLSDVVMNIMGITIGISFSYN